MRKKIVQMSLCFVICVSLLQGCSKKVLTTNYPINQIQSNDYSPPKKYYEVDRTGSIDNTYPQNQVKQKLAELEEKKQRLVTSSSESKDFTFDNAEVIGYLDAPSPQYQSESQVLQRSRTEKSENIDAELEQLKQQLDRGQVSEQSQPSTKTVQKVVKPKRMITYDGFISSRSVKPDSLISKAVALTESLKGFVEARYKESVTLRIPVNSFSTVFDSLLKLGEIIDYQRSAEDITDAYRDTDLRVTVLEKTIERYVKLIKLVKEEKDKISLLKEIERLREELENLKVQKSVLSRRAEFGKIVYSVQQITTGFAGIQRSDQIEGFGWLSYLDPINQYNFGSRQEMAVPEGMVNLKDREFWIAQSPAGSKIWTTVVSNNPSGTSDFWINAVAFKLKEQYLFVDTSSVSEYRFIKCTPQPGVNYRYYVGVKVVDKKIQVIQCYFPDELQENRYFSNIKKVLTTTGGAS